MKKKPPIVVIAAHPDDEVLGVGGTIAKKSQAGHPVHVIYMATGISARYPNPEQHQEDINREIIKLKKNVSQVSKILGITQTHFLDFPDNRLDAVAKMDIVHALYPIVAQIKPQTIFTHHYGDYNWDHRVTYDVTLYSCRVLAHQGNPQELYTYEVLSSTERAYQNQHFVFTPNTYHDIKSTLELKQKAMLCYETEKVAYPHPRSSEAIEYLARKRGNEVELELAEGFNLIKQIYY